MYFLKWMNSLETNMAKYNGMLAFVPKIMKILFGQGNDGPPSTTSEKRKDKIRQAEGRFRW